MINLTHLIEQFNRKEAEISRLEQSTSVLYVDLQSICPPDAKEARGEQLSELSGLIYEKIVDEKFTSLITSIKEHPEFTNQSDELIRKISLWEKEIKRKLSLNKDLVQNLELLKSKTNSLWNIVKKSEDEEDKKKYLDSLDALFKAKLEEYESVRDNFSYSCAYDYFLDSFEEDTKQDEIEKIFLKIKKRLLPLVKNIDNKELPISPPSLLKLQNWELSSEKQEELLNIMFTNLGLNSSFFTYFKTTHPFMISLGPKEVRVGIAFRKDPPSSFTSGVHESGHALYEHNQEYKNSILMGGTSLGIHESQSLFWQSHIASSKAFLSSFYSEFVRVSNGYLDDVAFEDFYAYANRVSKSLIRLEGDELTYPLHIIIRYEIERDLFANKISVYDIESVWREKYLQYFNKEPSNFEENFLQDVHWSEGEFGYFPTYLLGRVYAAQIEKEMKKRIPHFEESVSRIEFDEIIHTLKENIHKFGRLKTNKEIIKDFCREECNPDVYVNYLENKFNSLYNLKQ